MIGSICGRQVYPKVEHVSITLAPSFAFLLQCAYLGEALLSPSVRLHRHLPLAYISGFWSLITLLLLSSGSAYAEWVQIDKTDDEGTAIYINPDTIRRKGGLVKMWYMMDYSSGQTIAGNTSFSIKTQEQYDCPEERHRRIATTFFSGHMGNGKVNFSGTDESKWEPVEPESVGEVLWKFACNRK
jgi:hypothetical protein